MTQLCTHPARFTGTVSEDPIKDYLRLIGRTPLLTAAQEVELGERIEAGHLAARRLGNAGAAEELATGERRELRRRIADGQRAKDHMVEANLRLVVSIAKRYPTPTGTSLLDLVQEGTLGMMRAVEKFDHRRGLKFSTYATWWIKQSIGRALADQSRTIRIPVHVVEVLNRLHRAQRTLAQHRGRAATVAELAAELELSQEKVRELLDIGREPLSLHTPVGEDATEFGELIADTAPDPSDTVTASALRGQLDKVLGSLTEREAEVIALRFGLRGGEPRTLDEVGKSYGVSRERARQIEAKGMAKLRRPGRATALEGLLG
ncbi:sigma-70 family RNA polymerase sigma factor [Nocardia sp. NBC_00508]|uniref:sigma-70 family RNA polymerase sigma factor n=1 Tax=Nocardia sp. NBC_00508 TaxID=2975992 RepID=UPI002E814336|nr:sigma-70 family RNA polymerase sigma factor [Nocardia sp. NBC_00508]WUD68314.1 sigma-70 family RNA polymerase sigma factor [Nocardia sp. NBC_00508]